MNWRKAKKVWKRTMWRNRSNKSMQTYLRVCCMRGRPNWREMGLITKLASDAAGTSCIARPDLRASWPEIPVSRKTFQ